MGALVVLALWLPACGVQPATNDLGNDGDEGSDAPPDTTPDGDAGADLSPDATMDAAPDAAADVSPDATMDPSPDTPADASADPDATGSDGGCRDPLRQPFASTSIWNMPIGSGAAYVPGAIPQATGCGGISAEQDQIILRPTAPDTPVYYNGDGWSGGSRCAMQGAPLFSGPLPTDYVIPGAGPGWTPNNSGAVLLADGRTLVQTQPLTHCAVGMPWTSGWALPEWTVNICGDGILGSHGGSGLSAIGGTIRLGELVPGGAIRHAMKVNLNGSDTISSSSGSYRWPAVAADSCAPGCYGGSVPALRMGALLALPASVSIASLGLETTPGQMLAWTFQNYGAYLVDNAAWSVYALAVENSPDGILEQEFQTAWGFSLGCASGTPFSRDMDRIFGALAVVDNNDATHVGGGGTPLQPLADPLCPCP